MIIEKVPKVRNVDAIIWTEGKTDWRHLKKAIEKLKLGLNISFQDYEGKNMGDTALFSRCKTFAETPHAIPMIFVFDNDNDTIVKQVTDPNGAYKLWGNNVFSFAIPIPSHREGYENVSIELYFTDTEIKTKDAQERRIFLTSEFSETSGTHKDDPMIHIGHKGRLKNVTVKEKTKVVDSEVYRSDENITLSKSNFAHNVYHDIHPFNQFNFDEFRKIFDIIHAIIQVARPRISLSFPNLDEFFEYLQIEESPSQQFSRVFESMINVLEMTLQLFIVTTIRCYEDIIVDEPVEYLKKARAIKEIISAKLFKPSLTVLHELTKRCFYLIDEKAPEGLLNMKTCLDDEITLGVIGDLFDDLEKVFPPESRRPRIANKAQIKKQMLDYILVEFSKYRNKLASLKEEIESRNGDLHLDIETWKQALELLVSLVSPILSHIFALTTLEQVETVSGNYVIVTKTYEKDGNVTTLEKTGTFEEFGKYQSNISELQLTAHQDPRISIGLFPFLVVKDDRLFFYKRTRAAGYEYYSISNDRVYVFPTKKKFSHSVFEAGGKGDQQALFWTEVLPSRNEQNGITANIPIDEDRVNFVGRKKHKKIIVQEIIEIPNQNGIIYGVGGVGKTALMLQVCRNLFDADSSDHVHFANIIWVSAKSNYYNPFLDVVEKKKQQFQSLDNIISVIFHFFGFDDLEGYTFEEKKELVLELFKESKILLILDNFESISRNEARRITRFFDVEVKRSLRRKPGNFKVIITSREQIPCSFHQVRLSGLGLRESRQLMARLLREYKSSERSLSKEQQERIYQVTLGIPIVIKHCFGQVFEYATPLDTVIGKLSTPNSQVVEFSFAEIFKLLKKDNGQLKIILLLERIPCPLLIRQVAEILEMNEYEVDSKISTLMSFQCIKSTNQGKHEKYLVNDEIRLLTRRLAYDNAELVKYIRQKITRNFSLDKQMDYTADELGIFSIFNNYLTEKQYLEGEDFIKEELTKRPQSILLNFHYAKYLKEQRREIEKAIELLESIRESSNNHPSILRLLFSCYTSLDIPNYSKASVYADELERSALFDDENIRLEMAEFYVNWSTSIKLRKVLDSRQFEEIRRQQRYKDLADKAIFTLDGIENKTHVVYYLFAQSYFNNWDNKKALRMINKAISSIEESDPSYYSLERCASLKGAILAKMRRYSTKDGFRDYAE